LVIKINYLSLYQEKQPIKIKVMKTLKEQLSESVNCNHYAKEANQNCEIIEKKKPENGYDCEFVLVNFINESNNPSKLSGLYVVVIEEEEISEIDKSYVKQIFNK
jgi:hypothetical protein